MSTYIFEKPLIRGKMLKRKSQFTALVEIDGEKLVAHIQDIVAANSKPTI